MINFKRNVLVYKNNLSICHENLSEFFAALYFTALRAEQFVFERGTEAGNANSFQIFVLEDGFTGLQTRIS